jgi:hypothetical protein
MSFLYMNYFKQYFIKIFCNKIKFNIPPEISKSFNVYFFAWLECVAHSVAYIANLAAHLPNIK